MSKVSEWDFERWAFTILRENTNRSLKTILPFFWSALEDRSVCVKGGHIRNLESTQRELGGDFKVFKHFYNSRHSNFVSLSDDFKSASMSGKSKKEIAKILEMCEVVSDSHKLISVRAFIVLFAVYYRNLITTKEIRDYVDFRKVPVGKTENKISNSLSKTYQVLSDSGFLDYDYHSETSRGGIGVLGRTDA